MTAKGEGSTALALDVKTKQPGKLEARSFWRKWWVTRTALEELHSMLAATCGLFLVWFGLVDSFVSGRKTSERAASPALAGKKQKTHLLLRPRVEKPGQDVPGVAEHQLHVHVARLLGDRVHVLAPGRRQVAPDLSELNARVLFFQFVEGAVEHSVAQGHEDDV